MAAITAQITNLSIMAARGRAKVAKDVVVGDLADVLGAHLQGHGTAEQRQHVEDETSSGPHREVLRLGGGVVEE
eukprot:4439575-Amphidinium_carterae.1